MAHDFEAIDPWIEVRADGLPEIGRYLRDERDLAFDMLHCITAVDYFEPDAKKAAQVEWQPHLELIYHLSSMVHRHRLVLKVRLPRWQDDKPGQLPEVPSVSSVWSTAEWHEREVFDLMGVLFLGPSRSAAHPLPGGLGGPSVAEGLPDAGRVSRDSGEIDRCRPSASNPRRSSSTFARTRC